MNAEDTATRRQVGRTLLVTAAAGLVLALAASSAVFVDETEFLIVERFGEVVAIYDRPADRGLQFKAPWPIDSVRRFDSRVQLFDPPGREVFTKDKKNVTIDPYLCWNIDASEPGREDDFQDRPVYRFFTTVGSIDAAQARLNTEVISRLITLIANEEFDGLVAARDDDGVGPLRDIPREVQSEFGISARERYGIKLVAVTIKRINFPLGNQQAVFERMKSERKKIAEQYRSDGLAENTKIRSQADLNYSKIMANAERDAEIIRGKADAEAVSILNTAHQLDPDFYRFTRTLDAYKEILNDRTTLVLSASSRLLKLLTEGVPDQTVPGPVRPSTSVKPETEEPMRRQEEGR